MEDSNINETFYFLKDDYPKIEKICQSVEENIYSKPEFSIVEGRKASEKIIDEVINNENLEVLKKLSLYDKIEELNGLGIFSSDNFVFKAFDYNRKLGNIAAHHEVRSEISNALRVHENLFIIGKWFHDKYFDKYEIGEYKNPFPSTAENKKKVVEENVSITEDDQKNTTNQGNIDNEEKLNYHDTHDLQENNDNQDMQNNQDNQEPLNNDENEYNNYVGSNLDSKLNMYFPGKVVRKDLTKKIKEGANVPVYVLEYLLGKYCASDDELQIKDGVKNVRGILADNFVRPDEAQKVISKIREIGSYTVIDKVSVKLNYKNDRYEAEFSNLGLKGVPIAKKYPKDFERLLGGDIWCMINFEYFYDEADHNRNPFVIKKLNPIQMPNLDLEEILSLRDNFTKEEWIDILLRSCGMEPTQFDKRVKWLLLSRLVPLVENNFNLCELGPRSTGKSHVYKEISPNSILVSGGQTTVANLFYNMSTRLIGLVGMWDCVAFDEVAGIKFKDNDGIAIMKDYMASGSFSRGKDEKNASASMVFVGNINQSVDSLLKTSSLFAPFPDEMGKDTAFFDRMHCYIPGWEIPKLRPEHFTNDYGFITDYLAEFMREMRKTSFGNVFDDYFKLGNDLNQRDTIAVRKMISGLTKLIYPNGNYDKEKIREILVLALECRRRVKEQLKKIGGMEFYDINFSYIDIETDKEEWVGVKEQSSGKLIPEGTMKPGHLFTVGAVSSGHLGVFKIETEVSQGSGKFKTTGLGSSKEVREAVDTAYNYLKSNSYNVSASISTKTKDYLMEIQDLNGIGMTKDLALASFVALCSAALEKPVLSSTAILGSLSIGGTLIKVDDLANTLQACLDNGAKKILLPASSTVDLPLVPLELIGKFSLIFYQSPEDAVFKALGAE